MGNRDQAKRRKRKSVREPRGRVAAPKQTKATQKRAEETLRESEERYRGLFEHMVEGYAYCQMIFEDGQARDWIYLAVNEAFETLT